MDKYQGISLFLFLILILPSIQTEQISVHNVQHWAKKLGMELWWLGSYVTRREELLHKYRQSAGLEERSGHLLVQELAKEIKLMMDLKISAVKRIMDAAENTAMSHHEEIVTSDYDYWNAKPIKVSECPEALRKQPGRTETQNLILTPNTHFYNEAVNTSVSAVQVPTNVYDRAEDVIRAIKWSENLDDIFTNNYRMDPSLSWQFFCSSEGFLRYYPASKWKYDDKYEYDLYDCRTRGWYIEAATSAKDVLILVDNSGSMTGDRKEIARHVANNILDTLGNNDFVNIYTFSDSTQELVPCFRDKLVQATLGNVREFKLALKNLTTTNIANFTSALSKAFEILQITREERMGAMCNQAIMLITDGVPFKYEEVFQEFNWREKPYRYPVRVFTYLVGLEVPDVSQVKWMACENQGYYVHLSTKAEVREQVLNYIQVMARPMVLQRIEHPEIWTPVYVDIKDPTMSDWEWEEMEKNEQKETVEEYRKNSMKFLDKKEKDRRYQTKLKIMQDQSLSYHSVQLMTTISMPVFDRRDSANITERVLVNEAYWVKHTFETRIANLLGVAGTDIPIKDLIQLMSPHQIGVNGYAFIVTNNGFVLTHPDFRPLFQSILKPSYNSIDLSEVELMDNDDDPRDLSDAMKAFRQAVIDQLTGTVTLNTRYHFDEMRRVGRMKRHYYYTKIDNTPFTLVIALPDLYGTSKVHGMEEIRRSVLHGQPILSHFQDKKWRIHPDWIYCKYHYDTEHPFDSPEEELKHFLKKAQEEQGKWKWPLRFTTPPEQQHGEPPRGGKRSRHTNGTEPKAGKVDKNSYFCDRLLLLSLIFDAKITEGFAQKLNPPTDDQGKEMQEQLGITVSFVSTRSGLTRWHDNPLNLNITDQLLDDMLFGDKYSRSIDELWYKRAVDHYFVQPESFVYSVPHEAGYNNDTLVTASNALFITNNERRAPVGVVGFQFLQSAFYSRFMNITSKCSGSGPCHRTCASDDVSCYILDNHGYIVVASKSLRDTGRFFGEVHGHVMELMIKEKIYEQIKIYDYQGVCFEITDKDKNCATRNVNTPWSFFRAFIDWSISKFLWTLTQANLQSLFQTSFGLSLASEDAYTDSENYPEGDGDRTNIMKMLKDITINRTLPQACDRGVDLYQLSVRPRNAGYEKTTRPGEKTKRTPITINNKKYDPNPAGNCKRPFLAELVDASNLILVVVDETCYIPPVDISVIPSKIEYENVSTMQQSLSSTLACYKAENTLPRVKLRQCINHHPNESEIILCGKGGVIEPCQILLFTLITICWLLIKQL